MVTQPVLHATITISDLNRTVQALAYGMAARMGGSTALYVTRSQRRHGNRR